MKLPEKTQNLVLRQFQANSKASIAQILHKTGISSRKLAIETIEFPLDLTLQVAEALDLSICLDTGHILAGFSGDVDIFDTLNRCASRLAEIHLHDCPSFQVTHKIGYGKDHQELGRGDLDIHKFLDELDNLNFSGPIIFELSVPAALSSLQTIFKARPDLAASSLTS